MKISALNRRRIQNFKSNRRAFWSLILFSILFILSLFAEFIANDKPLLISYRDNLYFPILNFYSEEEFGGEYRTEAVYTDIEVQCLIATGGITDCVYEPEVLLEDAKDNFINGEELNTGWMIWPLIPFAY
ncbi:MAG: ABC transporter permease, partial [Rhodobacteraceae bacterium]|nr:ABC transporter permease [Paracoccaceae bacterium]